MTLCTEAEAKQKWCPFARVGVHAGDGGAAVNRHPHPTVEEDARCRASGCMVWRWHDREHEFHETGVRGRALTPIAAPEGEGWELVGGPALSPGNLLRYRRPLGERRRGFCGAGGAIVAGPSVPAMTVAR